ncbi:MAG TPA: double-strand break repair helicase AddA, partial [Caulobacteraceae bacterium]|nr:double-strand break repair helicase AddA [Caulobacteraceae bacterium]
EMQRRLFLMLGEWAVMADGPLQGALAELDEAGRDLSKARMLFARALETPGGLKIQTIHAFCEKLLRRFPLEAGVSPGFTVLEDAAAAEVSARARDSVSRFALGAPDGAIAKAYAHFSVELDWRRFNEMFAAFEARRAAISAYVAGCGGLGGAEADVWARCGFTRPVAPAQIEAEAVGRIRWGQWRRAARALLATGMLSDERLGAQMQSLSEGVSFAKVCAVLCTQAGEAKKLLGTKSVDPVAHQWLAAEQERIIQARERVRAAVVAGDTVKALTLATAYDELYEGLKTQRGALDFGDLIARTHRLLTSEAGSAAWVLYKLDGGVEHVLLDEAQDTAPDQWDILRALTAEFFVGAGAGPKGRTMFAVGDEKQSIFSFQGADPQRMALEKQAFKAMIETAVLRFQEVQLLQSWRSAPEILSFVDNVFDEPGALAALRPAKTGKILAIPLKHEPRRRSGGCVELWPMEVTDPSPELDPWQPVDAEPVESANKKLARRIAVSVGAMVARGDAVGVRDTEIKRPCAYGDVLILVRRRSALFHEIIRALKREGVPVGGADRLKLSEHVVFDDLMALAKFVRFPTDDLTLAALLRSPFTDVDEQSLFDLAWRREGSLWSTLVRRADERPEWRTARAFLAWAAEEAQRRPPFDFYSRILSRLDETGRSMRQRILTRLGAEAQDALDAFLAEALSAEGRDLRDLESFIAAMAASDIEVKREQEDAETGGEVRVMTVHGAKGLEAPIVILPDTTTRATAQGGPLLDAEGGGFLWAPRKADDCPASARAREARDEANEHESLRLLYVALTRARDRLIVAGVESQKARFERSWRDWVARAFDKVENHPFALDGGGEGLRYGADPVPATAGGDAPAAAHVLPDWSARPAPPEPTLARPAAPSGLVEDDPTPAPSPLAAVGGLGRFRRGDIIHHLLQILPDIPEPDRQAAARALLGRESNLTEDQRTEMAGAAMSVLTDPRFAAVFGPGSRPEVALAGAARGIPVSGRVDRLLIEPERVLVVDFKTNRPAPGRIEDAHHAYIVQMAVYAALLGEVFPGRRIEAALVWTDGPKLMPVPEKLMLKALDEIAANG